MVDLFLFFHSSNFSISDLTLKVFFLIYSTFNSIKLVNKPVISSPLKVRAQPVQKPAPAQDLFGSSGVGGAPVQEKKKTVPSKRIDLGAAANWSAPAVAQQQAAAPAGKLLCIDQFIFFARTFEILRIYLQYIKSIWNLKFEL